MKWILTTMIFFVTVVSCTNEHQDVVTGRRMYKAYLNKSLKDPSSLKIYSEKMLHRNDTVFWVIDFGAKNGFGAMTRETYCMYTLSGFLIGNSTNGDMVMYKDLEGYF